MECNGEIKKCKQCQYYCMCDNGVIDFDEVLAGKKRDIPSDEEIQFFEKDKKVKQGELF